MNGSPKILLTGATGFLGRALVSDFARRQVKPRCLVRRNSRTDLVDAAGFEKVEGDITDIASLPAALEGIDTVVHAAAVTGSSDPSENHRINAEGSANVIAACRDRGVRRAVVVSTISADLPRRGAYGDSKLIADNLFLSSGLDVTLIRATLIFGPASKQIDAIRRFVTMLPAVIPVIGDGRYKVQPVDVQDVARVVVSAALERPPKRFYYAAGPDRLEFNEMLVRMMSKAGVRKRLLHFPYFFVHTTLSIAGKFVRKLPVNAAQVSTLCQDAVCPIEDTEKDFHMTFAPFDRILSNLPA